MLDESRQTSNNINQHRPTWPDNNKGRDERSWTETRPVHLPGSPSSPGAPGPSAATVEAARSAWGVAGQVGRRRAGRVVGRVVQGRSIAAYPAGGPTYPGPTSPRANGWPDGRESWPAACAAVGCPPGPRSRGAAVLVWPLCGRESIFLFSHTNEFCGKSKVAPEAGVAWIGLKVGRRVCERGQQRKQLPARCSSPQGRPQRAQRLCRFAGWPAHPGNRALKTPVPYLAGTFRGPLLGATLRPVAPGHSSLGPEELTGLTRPPRSRRPSVPARRTGDA